MEIQSITVAMPGGHGVQQYVEVRNGAVWHRLSYKASQDIFKLIRKEMKK